jgi:molecular chaperone HtpG
MSNEYKFQVNLRGVINLLSDHLYSGPQVYLRELLQNSVDAITARQHLSPDHVGEIQLEVVAAADRPPTLVVHDNGVGLTEAEVHQFLATIGQSSKSDALQREDFIGQFGIGLLSGFVVCEEIVVITRSVQPEGETIEWKGRSDGSYSVRVLDYDFEPGTQVFLRAKPGCHEYFETPFVHRTARHFGGHLPYDIFVRGDGESVRINETPPWRYEYADRSTQRDKLLEYGREVFEMDFLDAFPLQSEVGEVEGAAFILPHAASTASKQTHRVYLKNMLLSEQVGNLLPDWAFFVKCVVNANQLRPTAARESFYEDENLQAARQTLGNGLKGYLMRLAREDRDRLDQIIGLHYLPIKALALEDDEFYRLFIDWLPFETSLGSMTLHEYRQQTPVVRYVRSLDQFRQISSVASAQSMCVINAGYVYDADLLERLPRVFPEVQIEEMDASELTQNFEDLTLQEREQVFELVRLADMVLQPYRCSAEIKKFQPGQLPALYISNNEATFLRSIEQTQEVADDLWSGVLGRLAEAPASTASSQLCLNYNNPLIGKLAQLQDRNLAGRSLEMLYVQALLLGHYPLKAGEMNLLSDGLLGLIEYGVNASQGEDQ